MSLPRAAAGLALLAWFGVCAAVVVWCVSYLFWGEYRTVTVLDDGEAPNCVGTWCTDGTAMRSPATVETASGTEEITVLGDYEAGTELPMLIGPLPGLGLTSRFEAVFPLILVLGPLIASILVNLAFWTGDRD
ncbi:hypothetical protein [Glycomyces terrestris]|uniref:Uncharacterized protein n=1 Tax=Glycomyces terrestris TaxID=2493553 RepID=A0A426UY02_9ACTN|nr:hypothetical protein [Glycomyces terrestris]RRR99443.1 hypothetical protein EIW28_12095 [Glycomyces terrestris]